MRDEFIKNLVNQMTLEEKIGQCVQISGDYFHVEGEITGPVETLNLDKDQIYNCGSILGVVDVKTTRMIQENYLSNNRLKIPMMFMADVVHGCNTIFPIPLALASSFNPKLAELSANVAAKEARVQGCHVTFAPMVDLAHDARWGRNLETNGEDPYLNKVFAKEYVKGFQGQTLDNELSVASCVKHFAGYGLVNAAREYNTVDVSERFLREYHFPSYKAAIDADAKMVMTAFNTIDSIPALANKYLMRNILRDEMNFKNVTISDWGAVKELINHQVAKDKSEAALKAMSAGLDIEMMTDCYSNELVDLVKQGKIDEQTIDESVRRILTLKYDLGLFEAPYKFIDPDEAKKIILSEEHKEIAKKSADESIVLLENKNNILPISNKKIGLYGPMANSRDLMGAWSWAGRFEDVKTIKEIFEENNHEISYIDYKGTMVDMDDFKDVKQVIFCGGETAHESGEAKSKTNIELSQEQKEVIRKFNQHNIDVIFVMFGGRPIVISDIQKDCLAIINAWFPGTMGAYSIYDILTGTVNPSAKLAMSMPRSTGQCPISYRDFQTGRPKSKATDGYVSKYIDCENDPLYSFGHGLNYSDIKINSVEIKNKSISDGEDVIIDIEIENYSQIKGQEVLQVYINDLYAEVVRPLKELKQFEKIELDSNEKKQLKLVINYNDLKYVNLNRQYQIDVGAVEIMVGLNSQVTHLNVIEII